MKKIVLYSIIVTILAAAVALIIMLYIKNMHSDMVSSTSGNEHVPYEYIILPPPADDGYHDTDCCYAEEMQGDTEENMSFYFEDITIDEEGISQTASFAANFLKFLSFPFLTSSYHWISMSGPENSYTKFTDLKEFVDRQNNRHGKTFLSVFAQIYKNKVEYLNNGELQRYIKLFASLISHEAYFVNGWDAIVHQLLIAYNDLAATNSFRQVYEVMTSSYGNPASYYDEIRPFVNDWQLESFVMLQDAAYYKTGEVNQSAVVWAYSFWGRRHNENPDSIEPIVAILRLLRDELYM
jgi:hypothetical protein